MRNRRRNQLLRDESILKRERDTKATAYYINALRANRQLDEREKRENRKKIFRIRII